MDEIASDRATEAVDTADRLHSAAIHLLRRLRKRDHERGISAARLSALSVVVFGGPITMGELAAAEGVQLPTISRLISAMEHEGLVARQEDVADRRVVRVRATEKGKRLTLEGRRARVEELASMLQALPDDEVEILTAASKILEALLHERHAGEP